MYCKERTETKRTRENKGLCWLRL